MSDNEIQPKCVHKERCSIWCNAIIILLSLKMEVSAERELSEVQAALLSPKVNMELNGNETYEKHENEGQFSVEETNSKGRKLPFPRGATIVLINKFFERFAFNGTRAVLVMYLTRYLAYSSQNATIIYHAFLTIIFMMSIFGAIIADSWLGKYRTVIYMYSSYAIGLLVLNLSSYSGWNMPSRELTVAALLLIAVGAGSSTPCIIALGGDQFQLPQQSKQIKLFYSLTYMMLKVSYLCGTALTPVLRNDVKCFGDDYCFPLAFGVPGSFVVLAFAIILIGNKWLIKRMPTENILVRVSKCIWRGSTLRWRHRKTDAKEHWLDHAVPDFGSQLVIDVKAVLNCIVIFLPLPMFWALNEQTASRWTIQAAELNGDLGFYEIKADQMQIAMPLLVIIFIILLDFCLYPLLQKIGINSDLRRILVGAFLAVLAFIASGVLELQTQRINGVNEVGFSQVRLFNPFPYGIKVKSDSLDLNELWIPPLDSYQTHVSVNLDEYCKVQLDSESNEYLIAPFQMHLKSGQSTNILFQINRTIAFAENKSGDLSDLTRIRILSKDSSESEISMVDLNHANHITLIKPIYESFLKPSRYRIIKNGTVLTELDLGSGSITYLIIGSSEGRLISKTVEVSPANSVHVLWMLPQYALLALAEAIVGVNGIRFAYTEAPESMKAVLQACWLLTVAFGNLIDLVIVSINIFETDAYESFLFAGLMFADSLWLMWLVKRYKRVDYEQHVN